MPFEVGDEIGKRYTVKERLGGGTFGDVYLAWDQRLQRDVAVKVPKDQDMDLERSLEEPRILAKLKHRNINLLWGVEECDGIRFLVLEFADGGNLRKKVGRIGEQKPLPFEESIDVIKQVSFGLQIAHRKNIFHRDIKPENILFVAEDNVVEVADFGISKLLEPTEKAMTVAGSRPYMAPEILGKDGGAFYSDIWSLMVMSYELLTRRPPFNSLEETLQKERIEPPSQVKPGLMKQPYYEDIDSLILDGLNRKVDARPTIDQALQRLEEYERKVKIGEKAQDEGGQIPPLVMTDPEMEALLHLRPRRQPFAIKVWVDWGTGGQTRDIQVVRRDRGYKIGDRITVKFTADRDCYLTLFDIGTSGAITRIFPNQLHRENFIRANRVYRIPEDDHGFDYELRDPPGIERLKAIATLQPIDLTEGYLLSQRNEIFPGMDRQRFLRDIQVTARKIQGLPEGSWAEDGCAFRVE